MPTLEEVINFILTTENIEDLPTIGDALNERFATEIGLVAEGVAEEESFEEEQEAAPEEVAAPTEEEKGALPPLAL